MFVLIIAWLGDARGAKFLHGSGANTSLSADITQNSLEMNNKGPFTYNEDTILHKQYEMIQT